MADTHERLETYSQMKINLAILVGYPMLFAAVCAGGTFCHPVLAAVPGLCVGFIGWTQLLREVGR